MMEYPSGRYCQNMVRIHDVKHHPISLEGIPIANSIFSPDLGSIKGKTVQTTPCPVVQDYAAAPALIRKLQPHARILVNIMYMNYLTFLVTVPKSL